MCDESLNVLGYFSKNNISIVKYSYGYDIRTRNQGICVSEEEIRDITELVSVFKL